MIGHKQIDEGRALLALRMLVEGSGVRSVSRITGLTKRCILKLLVNAGERCEALLATKVRKCTGSRCSGRRNLGILLQEGSA